MLEVGTIGGIWIFLIFLFRDNSGSCEHLSSPLLAPSPRSMRGFLYLPLTRRSLPLIVRKRTD